MALPRPALGHQQPVIQSGRSYLRFKASPRQGQPLAGSLGRMLETQDGGEASYKALRSGTTLVLNKAASRVL